MIENDLQYRRTKRLIKEFQAYAKKIKKDYSSAPNKNLLYTKGHLDQIKQMEEELKEYEKIKKSPLPRRLTAHSAEEIGHQLVLLRIASGLTQERLAKKIGCKQSDISRLEREEYQGYTLRQLRKIADALGAGIELSLIPNQKKSAA